MAASKFSIERLFEQNSPSTVRFSRRPGKFMATSHQNDRKGRARLPDQPLQSESIYGRHGYIRNHAVHFTEG